MCQCILVVRIRFLTPFKHHESVHIKQITHLSPSSPPFVCTTQDGHVVRDLDEGPAVAIRISVRSCCVAWVWSMVNTAELRSKPIATEDTYSEPTSTPDHLQHPLQRRVQRSLGERVQGDRDLRTWDIIVFQVSAMYV